ncbi:TIGR03086 family metal-binding protein [Pseudonocardia sp. 73-21]|jgi:uncharacterized protein (TIGR03086 family)|uniref:TIGR03086 family metal-binding protein n=1 Tax=Pseudonocardia sp. 73-21 TaxID=1895809 RepID=UPI00095FB40B|nr:TIGR03086 family metal-binding protein [Pseudonocardia sp. 73-21]OJY43915.1 MAG: TIGR03086 family protein [Pseudonocardia sp. 73-21]
MTQTTETVEFGPAARALAQVVDGVRDDQLDAPTPCPAYTVADLLDHVAGLTVAFTAAARKQALGGDASGDGSRLPEGWRERITDDLAELAAAWAEPAAYEGMTMAGPIEVPGHVAALIALNEVLVHGWDLARATGQPYGTDPAAVTAVAGWVAGFAVPGEVSEGPFGPAVAVPDTAPVLDRLVGLAGRDPGWQPS